LARRAANENIRRLSSPKVTVIDVEDLFIQPDGTVRAFDRYGQELYQDTAHLSKRGAQLVAGRLRPLLPSRSSVRPEH